MGNSIVVTNMPSLAALQAIKCKVCPEAGEKVKMVHPLGSMTVVIKFHGISLYFTFWLFFYEWKLCPYGRA